MSKTKTWISIKDELPPNGQIVHTRIDDGKGIRNKAELVRDNNLWFFPDYSMYVYYTPTHWKPKEEIKMKDKCGNCNYYNSKESLGPDVGECVVNPPTVIGVTKEDGKNMAIAYYPVVAHDQPGCRFHKYVAEPTIGPLVGAEAVNPNLKE
jgi:hypothetical protein